MPSDRYPLEAAASLRREEEERAKRGLARAIELHALSVELREQAERALTAHELETARVAEDERARDARGRSASEALTAQAWLSRRRAEAKALADARDSRRRDEAQRASEVEASREGLATARAEVEALTKHRASWLAEREKTRERREEAEIEDKSAHQGRS